MVSASSTALTDLLHKVRERYRLVHVDETQSVLLLYVERLLRAAGHDAMRLRHRSSGSELVVCFRPRQPAPRSSHTPQIQGQIQSQGQGQSKEPSPLLLTVVMEHKGPGSTAHLLTIGTDLQAAELWHLGWDRAPPKERLDRGTDPESTQQLTIYPQVIEEEWGHLGYPATLESEPETEGPRILRRSLREAAHLEAQGALTRSLRRLVNEFEASPESTSYIEPFLRDNAEDPRPAPSELVLRSFVATAPSTRDPKERPLFLLVGAPGSGKTTLLRHFAAGLAREYLSDLARGSLPTLRAPICVSVPSALCLPGEGEPDLDKFLEQAVPGLSGKMVRLLLELGLCVLLIDGEGTQTAALAGRLSQFPTLLPGYPPKAILCASSRYFAQAAKTSRPTTSRLIEEAIRKSWDLGFVEPFTEEQIQNYLSLRLPDPVVRSAALAQLARSENLRRLCRRPGLLSALSDDSEGVPPLCQGFEEGQPGPKLSTLLNVLTPSWLEGVAGDRRIERTSREVLARVLARKLRSYAGSVPFWDLLPEIAMEIPGEADGARLLMHVLRALSDTMFLVEEPTEKRDGVRSPLVRFALLSALDYFTGEDVNSRLATLPLSLVQTCLQRGHLGPIHKAVLSPCGRFCATAAEDGLVRLFETGTGYLLRVLQGHRDPVTALVFAGGALFSASLDLFIHKWHPESGKLLGSLTGHVDGIVALCHAEGSQLLASASRDGMVRLWDVETLRPLATHQGTEPLTTFALSRDGHTAALALRDGFVHIYSLPSFELRCVLGGHTGPVRSLALSPDGRLCASGGEDHAIRLTDTETGNLRQAIRANEGAVTALCLSPDGHLLLSGGADNTTRVFVLPAPSENTLARPLRSLREHSGAIHGLSFVEEPKRGSSLCVSASEDGTAILFDPRTGQIERTLDGSQGGGLSEASLQVRCLATTKEGDVVATGGADGRVRIWDLRKGRLVRELRGHEGGIVSMAMGPDPRVPLLATGSEDQSVCLWDPKTGEMLDRFEGHFSDVTAVAFSPDGYLLASGSADQTVRIRETQGGMMVRTLNHKAQVHALAFSPLGRYLATALANGEVTIWEAALGPPLQVLRKSMGRVRALAASPDGALWAAAGDDQLVRLFDSGTGRQIHALAGHYDAVQTLAFSSEGSYLVSAGLDRKILVWDVHSGQLLTTLRGAQGTIRSLSLCQGAIVTGGQDGVLLFSLHSAKNPSQGGRLRGQLCGLQEGYLAQVPASSPSSKGSQGPPGDVPRFGIWAGNPETPSALRVTDGETSYPASGFGRLCHRPHLVSQVLTGQKNVTLEEIQEDLLAAPLPMPVLESSGAKTSPITLQKTVFISEDSAKEGYGRMLTADELLAPEAPARGELVRGAVVPLAPVTYGPGRVTGRLHAHLVMHVFGRNLGDLPSSDTGYLLERNPDVLRTPDVSFVSRERVLQAGTNGYFTGAPDLAAEVISPTNTWEMVEQKAQEYLATGARLVWIIDPQTRVVHVHESPVRVRILGENDLLLGGNVLPGFSVLVRDLF